MKKSHNCCKHIQMTCKKCYRWQTIGEFIRNEQKDLKEIEKTTEALYIILSIPLIGGIISALILLEYITTRKRVKKVKRT